MEPPSATDQATVIEPKPKAREARRPSRWLLALAAAPLGLIWVWAALDSPLPLGPKGTAGGPRYRASGIVHVHTQLSDGRGSPADVVAAAARAKADFIVITDHNLVDVEAFNALPAKAGGPLVILGSEVSTEAGHILAIGISPPSFRFSGTLSEVLDDIRHLGGCAFAAHPTSARGETRFTREEVAGFGIEIVNGDSAWREASPVALALAAWTYPVNPAFALRKTLGLFAPERAMWDRMLGRRETPAIGGADAHGRIPLSRTRGIPIPSYEALFSLVRTVVHLNEPLPPNPALARSAITRALCAGESVVAIPSLADPAGFSFVAQTATGEVFGPGSTLPLSPGTSLRVGGGVPERTTLRLLESGRELRRSENDLLFEVVDPGVYRVEAYVPGETTPWILSNPISVLPPGLERSREQAARPLPAPFIQGTTVIDRFEKGTSFAAEHDAGSGVDKPILDPSGGRGSAGAALLSFRLNSTPRPPVWCALVDRTPRDLSKNRGISFWLKGDGEYRVWFQIRDLNPASADEGTEAWFASVRTSTAWTLQNIPFASLRSINKASDQAFDPSRIAHIVFVIDHGAMPFGSKGKVWIDDLMAY